MAKSTRARVAGTIEDAVAATTPNPADEKKRAEDLSKIAIEKLMCVGRPTAAMRLIVHGVTKVGKTNFLAHCPGVVFVPLEEGANQYPVPQWPKPILTLDDYNGVIQHLLYGKHNYKALAVDTADALERLLKVRIEQTLKENAKAVKDGEAPRTLTALNEEEWGAGYDFICDAWGQILRDWDRLRNERGMHILVAVHSVARTVRGPDHEDFVQYVPSITGAKASNLLRSWADAIVRIGIETLVSKNKQKTFVHQGDRFMYLTQKATHVAGCRGAVPWPDRLPLDETLGWNDFWETRQLIETHKADLPRWLGERAIDALSTFPEAVRGSLGERVGEVLVRRDYRLVARICEWTEQTVAAVKALPEERAAAGLATFTEAFLARNFNEVANVAAFAMQAAAKAATAAKAASAATTMETATNGSSGVAVPAADRAIAEAGGAS